MLTMSPGEAVFQGAPGAVQGGHIERDPEAARDIARKTGQTGVPVIKIGNHWIVGFDKERIKKELGLS
jgi:glutaredoxin